MSEEAPSIADNHLRDLKIAREFITDLITQLDLIVNSNCINDEMISEWKYIWGDKENAVSALTKLVSLLIKIIPIENDLAGRSSSSKSMDEISKEDDEIIERYIMRRIGGECDEDEDDSGSEELEGDEFSSSGEAEESR